MNIFITGTDTDVGKTFVTAGLAGVMQGLGYSVAVYKPVQSGAIKQGEFWQSPDLNFVKNIDPNITTKASYNFEKPVSPGLAAFIEGVRINPSDFVNDYKNLANSHDFVIVEGAGGLLVPVYNNFLIRDLVKLLDIPLVIVARPDLGTINHTLLSIEAAKSFGLKVKGVIISKYPLNTDDISIKTSPKAIKDLSGVDVLGILPEIEQSRKAISESLIDITLRNVDIQKVFGVKIPKLNM